ncbi:MAG TPA: phage Gp37/Gp68 family protein [Vitreimonas sp.]|uniref:DUF5131 family protein n=1 Tax=Vitreimonas sp. TaxID=3069702 RepID=UPI002D3EE11B|nr:phage Gp37/Gp68 family protein [Vitreimonas sp.]HYD87149.1 phage Gp37/Gp68 family protein [Vitreimonas sp.]
MSDGTKIEWAANADGSPGATWNPIRARRRSDGKLGWFCIHASEGCRLCYAERWNEGRFGNGLSYKKQNEAEVEIFLDEKTLLQPLRWKKPRTIFVCSMSDLFGEFVPDAFIDRVLTVAACAPQHTFIVLTKRDKRMRAYFEALFGSQVAPRGVRCPAWPALLNRVERVWLEERGRDAYLADVRPLLERGLRTLPPGPLPNVWLGVSIEDRENGAGRGPNLAMTPAAARLWSVEPLLSDLGDMTRLGLFDTLDGARKAVDWVIVGGESGPGARPMHPDWVRSIRDQCAAAGVAFFFKQWGAHAPVTIPKTDWRGETPVAWPLGRLGAHPWPDHDDTMVVLTRVGKRAAGRVLDGRTHDERPPLAHQRVAA